jgi:hypothetical protein
VIDPDPGPFRAELDAKNAATKARPLPDFDSRVETSDSGDRSIALLPEQSSNVALPIS